MIHKQEERQGQAEPTGQRDRQTFAVMSCGKTKRGVTAAGGACECRGIERTEAKCGRDF